MDKSQILECVANEYLQGSDGCVSAFRINYNTKLVETDNYGNVIYWQPFKASGKKGNYIVGWDITPYYKRNAVHFAYEVYFVNTAQEAREMVDEWCGIKR